MLWNIIATDYRVVYWDCSCCDFAANEVSFRYSNCLAVNCLDVGNVASDFTFRSNDDSTGNGSLGVDGPVFSVTDTLGEAGFGLCIGDTRTDVIPSTLPPGRFFNGRLFRSCGVAKYGWRIYW